MLLLLVTKYEQNPNKPIRNHSQKLCLGFKLATAVTTNKKTQGLQASGFGIWMFTLLKTNALAVTVYQTYQLARPLIG